MRSPARMPRSHTFLCTCKANAIAHETCQETARVGVEREVKFTSLEGTFCKAMTHLGRASEGHELGAKRLYPRFANEYRGVRPSGAPYS